MKKEKPIIVADVNIPFLKGVLDTKADVRYLSAEEITYDKVCDADALIVRTRTRCNEALLENSAVKFIATATIGFDHIDTDYCRSRNIIWKNAPGCNADSVGQYVASALCFWAKREGKSLLNLTLGIVGYGHVGVCVERYAKYLGMNVIKNDPPKQKADKNNIYVSLEEIAERADIVTFHTPLIVNGEYPTFHLAGKKFFDSLKRKPLIINSARGGVVDERALLEAIEADAVAGCVIDCWENEPIVNRYLLEKSLLATPHIAGYSADGKANATQACVRAVNDFFSFGLSDFSVSLPEKRCFKKDNSLGENLLQNYAIENDSERLKASPETFEQQRGNYPIRRECVIE